MKVLHLLSNWKWTERAEPAADLAAAQKAAGLGVVFACGRAPGGAEDHAAGAVGRKGVECVELRALRKHLNVLTVFRDAAEVRALLARTAPDIVHCHMPNAHLLAALARGRAARPFLVRSCYDPDGPPRGWRTRWLLARRTDGAVALTDRSADVLVGRCGLDRGRVIVSEPGIDVARFAPGQSADGGRESFGLAAGDFVVGVVSRIRAERRLDVALEGVARVAGRHAAVRLLVVGRGSADAVRRVIEDPAARLGIRDRVLLAGYCRGDRLVAAYRCMDVLVYPVPGTDRSCRTVREAMATGVPVIGGRVGFVPDLIADGLTGRVVELSGLGVAEALEDLLGDPGRLRVMKENATAAARARFATGVHAARVARLYEGLMKEVP